MDSSNEPSQPQPQSGGGASLPMPTPTNNPPLPLSQYKVLSFDIYGTLIEYKSHILTCFTPLLSRLPPASPYLNPTPLSASIPECATLGQIEFLKLFQRTEDTIKLERPLPRFDVVLMEIWRRIARELGVECVEDEARMFGSESNIASWPTFPGTLEALGQLVGDGGFRLVALSNIDRYAWEVTRKSSLREVEWWKVFTAEDFENDGDDDDDVGGGGQEGVNADEAKLLTLIEYCRRNGIPKEEILHVAQSLGHDHAPAKKLGVSSVFLIGDGARWGKEVESKMVLERGLVGYAWRCRDLREFVSIVG